MKRTKVCVNCGAKDVPERNVLCTSCGKVADRVAKVVKSSEEKVTKTKGKK